MKKHFTLTQEDFDALLGWLSPDRDEAGAIYERIREGLIRFFRFRGCDDPSGLADETINRVALKVSDFDFTGNVKTITFFYGFAKNVFLENTRESRKMEFLADAAEFPVTADFKLFEETSNVECDCLKKCLSKLPQDEITLVIGYYGLEKSEKVERRMKLAEERSLKMPALHTKIFRIRGILRECIEKCVAKNSL